MKNELPSSWHQFVCKYWKSILVCLLPILTSIIFYIGKLGSLELSSKPDVWGQFGDFLNFSITLSLGLGNLFLLYLLTRVANTIDSKNLEKELAFEFYKSFISNIDTYSINYFSISDDISKKRFNLALMHHLIKAAKVNFNVLLSESDNQNFIELADLLISEIERKFDNVSNGDVSEINDLITKIKNLIFKQIKL